MPHRIITDQSGLEQLQRILSHAKLPITVKWQQGKDRSLDQNHLQFLWAREAAEQLGDRSIEELRSEWKLKHGVPILRAEGGKFCDVYDRLIKPHPYEEKIKAMAIIPVSSLMTVRQMTEYLNAIEMECVSLGVVLTHPEQAA